MTSKKSKGYKDKHGREFIKKAYFVGGKMKLKRIYLIDGMPAYEFYLKNATQLDFYQNGDFEYLVPEEDNPENFSDENIPL